MSKVIFKRHPLPFRYPGGKYYALDILRPFWQNVEHDEYREPFVGGGSIFFNKAKSKINWLNDIDAELITTYRILANDEIRPQLVQLVEKEVASKERWKEVSQLCPNNDLDIAFKYFYLNRTSFSGKMVSSAWGYRPKRSLPPNRWHERIIPAGIKLQGVTLTTLDFESLIHEPPKGNQTLIYVDPPYFNPPKKKHYRHGFILSDHIRLSKVLKTTRHKFFLTYDNTPEVRELYGWANIHEVKFFYRVDNANGYNGRRRTGFEFVITNYELPNQLNMLQ